MRLIRLDSDGVTCEMIEVRIASLPPRDRGDVHVGVEFLQIDVAVRFAERRLGLEIFGVDEALDHDLGLGRHQQVDGLRLHDVDRRADQRAGDVQLVERLGQLLHRGEGDAGRRAEHHRARQLLEAARAQLFPVLVDARPQLQRRVHAEPAPRLHLAAVVAHVLDAGVGILGDVLRQRGVGRDVPARRRDRHRNAVEALPGLSSVLAGDDDLVARRVRRRCAAGSGSAPPRPSARRSRRTGSRCRCGRFRGWRRARRPAPGCRTCGPCCR